MIHVAKVFIFCQIKVALVSKTLVIYWHFIDCFIFYVECQCNKTGSNNNICDPITGQCDCRSNVIGNQCDVCNVRTEYFMKNLIIKFGCIWLWFLWQDGFWNISETGCQKCSCDKIGAINDLCDSESGQCTCKLGIGGKNCDQCLPNYYGFSILGCLGN